MQIESNFPLQPFNTFGLDVRARYFAQPESSEQFREFLLSADFRGMKHLILGGGSNLLLTGDINGLVLKNGIKGIRKIKEDAEHVWIEAGAGEPWHPLVRHCISMQLAGIENLSLIPGNVGAAPMQNIGAYGAELKDVFEELQAMDRQDGSQVRFTLADCGFGYRESVFKGKYRDRFIILSVTLRLSRIPRFNISYGSLVSELEKSGVQTLSLEAVSDAVCRIRRSKLPDPAKIGNAGSFFKNPEVDAARLQDLMEKYPGMPSYPSSFGAAKLAAGWLIERCGWKGYRQGDAGVHPLQALVLVNYGKAKGSEILDLASRIQQTVEDTFGVKLEREVNVY